MNSSEDTVRVLIRVRPKLPINSSSGNDDPASVSNNLTIDEKNNAISIGRGDKKGISEYKFTSVLGPQVSQAEVFNKCSDVVQESINGINCCIMAYGQTSSGKTHTMLGKGWEEFAMNSKSKKEREKTPAITPPLPTTAEADTDVDHIQSVYSDNGDDNDSGTGMHANANSNANSMSNSIDLTKSQLLPPATSGGGNQGIIPRLVVELFSTLEFKRKHCGETSHGINKFNYSVYGQFMQIYNEKLYDLLLDKSRSNPLQIRETSTTDGASEMNGVTAGGTSVHVKGLTQHKVLNKDDVFQMLKKGIRNRAIRSTDYNHESSRSHSIFQIIVVIEEPDEAGLMYTRRSTMSLVDLAGSEKWITNANAAANASSINNGPGGAGIGGLDSGVNTPNASMQLPTGGFNSLFNQQSSNSLNNSNIPSSGNTNGALDSGANNGELTDAQKELTHINTSLHILGLCVSALIEPGRKHIPYRDSVLTRLLQDSLSGNGRTILIGTIHESAFYREETYSTLQFASRASKIKVVFTPSITITEQALSMDLAKKQINILKQKLAELQLQQQEVVPPRPLECIQEKEDKTQEAINNEQLKEKVSEMFRENNSLRKQILILQEELSEQKNKLKQQKRRSNKESGYSDSECDSGSDSDDEGSDEATPRYKKRVEVATTTASKAKVRVGASKDPRETDRDRTSRKVKASVRSSRDSHGSVGSVSRVPRLPSLSPQMSKQQNQKQQLQPMRGKKYEDGYDSAVSNISMRSRDSVGRSQPNGRSVHSNAPSRKVKTKPNVCDRGIVKNAPGLGGKRNVNAASNRSSIDRQSRDRVKQTSKASNNKVRSGHDRKHKEEGRGMDKKRQHGASVASKKSSNSKSVQKRRNEVSESDDESDCAGQSSQRQGPPTNTAYSSPGHQSKVALGYDPALDNGYVSSKKNQATIDMYNSINKGHNSNSPSYNKHHGQQTLADGDDSYAFGVSSPSNAAYQSFLAANALTNQAAVRRSQEAEHSRSQEAEYSRSQEAAVRRSQEAEYSGSSNTNGYQGQSYSNGRAGGSDYGGYQNTGGVNASNAGFNMHYYQSGGNNAYGNQGQAHGGNPAASRGSTGMSTSRAPAETSQVSGRRTGDSTAGSEMYGSGGGPFAVKRGGKSSPDRVNDAFAAANAALGAGGSSCGGAQVQYANSSPDLGYKPSYTQQSYSQSRADAPSSYAPTPNNNPTSAYNYKPAKAEPAITGDYNPNGLCRKHGLDSCILCQISGESQASRKSNSTAVEGNWNSNPSNSLYSNRTSPSKGQPGEDSSVSGVSNLGYNAKLSSLPNTKPVYSATGTPRSVNGNDRTGNTMNASPSLNRYDFSSGMGSASASPYIPSSKTPNYNPSSSISAPTAGIVCSNHGVKDCLLCAMRAGTLNLNGSVSVTNSTNSFGLNHSMGGNALNMSGSMSLPQMNFKQSTDSINFNGPGPVVSHTPTIALKQSLGNTENLGSERPQSNHNQLSQSKPYLSSSFSHAQLQPPLSSSQRNINSSGIVPNPTQANVNMSMNANFNNIHPPDRTGSTGSSRGDEYVSTGNYSAHFANRATPLSTPPDSSEPGGLYGFVSTE